MEAKAVPSVTFRDGRQMPLLGLGTFMASSEVVGQAVDAALETGYRHIDTAYLYGNEAAIGQTLKKWLDYGRLKREELFVVTKLPNTGNRAESVEKYMKKSLEALQLSYVDLYLVHSAVGYLEKENSSPFNRELDMSTDHISLWKAMEAQVDAGRARSIGLSNFNARQVKRIVQAARIPPANLQVELNVYFQQRELVAFCKALDVTVCAYAPLGSPAFPEFLSMFGNSLSDTPILSPLSDPVVAGVAEKHGRTPAQVLLRHVVQRGVVAIPKSSNPERIRENFQVFDFELDADDLEKLDALDKGPKARVFGGNMRKDMLRHPEYPYNDRY
ncbi:aldo-keto reductase family 1 member A1-like isoform X2 [Bacillus rossius redtenbacheri]|uniref:aldo-keto reductase family 1 member A1-like isoform X2 n=1 Tax=Bacillus rossius redtenbacheri TaxID=93214 RepID=UPI002FDCA6D9